MVREDLQDARDKYVETVRKMQENRKAPARLWPAQLCKSEQWLKRHKQEIQPILTRRSY